MTESYPLKWPLGYQRTPDVHKRNAAFQTPFAQAREAAIEELNKMKATGIVVSTNVPLRRDGVPYAVPFGNSGKITDDTGVAVYFSLSGEQKVICCDAWLHLDDNMQAVRKSVEALRGLDRWKCSDIIGQAFTGFKALPEQADSASRPWWVVLEVDHATPWEYIELNYKVRRKQTHPDNGGGNSAFIEVQQAYEQAKKEHGL